MSDAAKELFNYGTLGIVVVVLSTLIGWAGLWARKIVEQVVTSYVANDAKRAEAAEVMARTQEHLGGLVGGIGSAIEKHGVAHKTTLSALQELIPPNSPVQREIAETKGRLA